MSDEYTNEIEKIRKEAIENIKRDFKKLHRGTGKSPIEDFKKEMDKLKKQLAEMFKIDWDEALKGDRWTIPNTSTGTEEEERKNLTFEKVKKIMDDFHATDKKITEKCGLTVKPKDKTKTTRVYPPMVKSCICCKHWEIEKEKTMLMGVCNTSVNKVRTDYGFHCKGWESIPKKA